MKNIFKNIKLSGGLIKFATFIFTFLLVLLITQEQFFIIAPLKTLELKLLDIRFSQRGEFSIKDTSDIIILEINQETYEELPNPFKTWPWPRIVFQKVVENLEDAGAKTVGIDLLWSNPDRMNPGYDTLFMNTIRRNGNIVIAGKVDVEKEAQLSRIDSRFTISKFTDSTHTIIEENFDNIFFESDSSIGIVQTPGDYDEVYRRYQPYVSTSTYPEPVPSFGFALLNKWLGLPPESIARRDKSSGNFILGSKEIPAFDNTTMLINFYGADRTFPRVNFYKVLDDEEFITQDEIDYEISLDEWTLMDQSVFKDKIVIIGSTMPEDKDFFNIPISRGQREGDNIIAGVEFHANAIQNVIWDDYIIRQPQYQEILLMFVFALTIFYLSSFLKQLKVKHHYMLEIANLVFVLIVAYAVYQFGIYYFVGHNFLISIVNPILAVVFSYFSVTAYHFITERSQNKMIRGMFSTYVSGDLVSELIKNPDKLKLGGEKRNLSILFSDIAGFTSFSERLQPEELVEFINDYLTEMTDIVLINQGTLDKYIGDAIMAIWGAPLDNDRHEFLACKTAIEMQRRVDELGSNWQIDGENIINVRIGINSGDVVVGNIGGRNRFDYTVMGDNVNLASRLEGANKQYGTGIMISESTYEKVKDGFITRELDTIRVKGKVAPTTVYELIGFKNENFAEQKLKDLENYFFGLKEYKNKNFEKAYGLFESAFKKNLEENASFVYMERCKYFIENPVEGEWDGVFVMKTK